MLIQRVISSRAKVILAVLGVLSMLGAAEASAQEEAGAVSASGGRPEYAYEGGGMMGVGLVFGAKLGGGFGQLTSELGSTFVGELELGYLLPFLDRSFEVFVSGQYAAPGTEGSAAADPRLPGDGVMSYTIVQRQAVISLGVLYRIPLDIPMFRPYVSAGWRTYLMRTEVEAEAGGQAYGAHEETAANYAGFVGALGGELHFGVAGAVLLEVQMGYGSLDGYVMRDTNVGSLNAVVGYRFFL